MSGVGKTFRRTRHAECTRAVENRYQKSRETRVEDQPEQCGRSTTTICSGWLGELR